MRPSRLTVLAAAVFALVLCACSKTDTLRTPGLEPQLGPPNTTSGTRVTVGGTSQVWATSNANRYTMIDGSDFRVDEGALSRYDRNGNLLWELDLFRNTCPDNGYYEGCTFQQAGDVASDSAGNAYTLLSSSGSTCDTSISYRSADVVKVTAGGTLSANHDVSNAVALTADSSGHFYTVGDSDTVQEPYGDGSAEACGVTDPDPPYARFVRKYSPSGTLLWARQPSAALGMPTDVAVAPNGNVYVVGDKGMSRYSSSGGLLWTQPVRAEEVIISGSALVSRQGLWVSKFSDAGTKLWSTFIGGLLGASVRHMDGDPSGNVYLTGNNTAGQVPYRTDAFVRKLNVSGKSQWTKTISTPEYDFGYGVASFDGSEIYIIGETRRNLSPINYASDGFLYKLNRYGTRVWIR